MCHWPSRLPPVRQNPGCARLELLCLACAVHGLHNWGVYNSTCQKAGTTAAWALLGMAIVGSAGTSHRPRVVLTHPRAPTQPSVAGRSHPALERSSLWTLSHDPVDLTEVTCPPSL